MTQDPRIEAIVAEQPYPLIFVTISGAHLYGFPSPDSDYDLRGCHVLPAAEVLGLNAGRETIDVSTVRDGVQMDLVTHDAKKYFTMVLKRNGYVLEQIYSPLVVRTTPEHAELKTIAAACITRHHAYHYLGFARGQWQLFESGEPRRVKPLLYVYRVLLTGIHLMRTGRIESSLPLLNEEFRLPYLPDLIARKLAGPETSALDAADVAFHEAEFRRLIVDLEAARDASTLPEGPAGRPALHDLLIRLRLTRSE